MPAFWVFAGLVLAVLECASSVGCGTSSGARGRVVSSPFTDADKQLFADSVDLVGDPEGLTGRWADDWAVEMRDRVQRSDFVAMVTVNTLRTEIDPSKHTTHWLLANVNDVWKGGLGDDELALPSSDDSLGFESVDRERTGILRRPLLVLGKWTRAPGGELRPHWHLAIASQQVLAVVRGHLAKNTPAPPRTIVERTQPAK
jgi:hypothetical protein